MFRTAFATLLLAILVAGCMGSGELGGTTLSYDGTESGTHKETKGCDEDGRVTGSGNVEDGQLHVKVMDGSGDELWSKTFDGNVDFDSTALSGASGEWSISAERTGNDLAGDEFNGEYTFNLSC